MNEWSTTLNVAPFKLQVAEAKILIDVQAKLPTCKALILTSPQEFLDFVSRNRTEISVTASLNVSLPVFVIIEEFGVGKRTLLKMLPLLLFNLAHRCSSPINHTRNCQGPQSNTKI